MRLMSKKVVAFAAAVAVGLILVAPVSNGLHYLLDGFGVVGLWSASIAAVITPIVFGYLTYRKLS
jgi:hypothetical protein